MGIISSFLNSLMLPKKKAVLAINKTKIGHSVAYLAALLFIVTLPDLIQLISSYDSEFSEVPQNVFIIQIVVFYPLQIIFLGLIGISFIAAIGVGISRLVKRNIKFALMWKMAIHASTTPLLLYVILKNLIAIHNSLSVLLFIFVIVILYGMITVYPKPKKK